MGNLRSGEEGKIWCPKAGSPIDPSPVNLAGCQHCPYCRDFRPDAGGVSVICQLVPAIPFCKRILIHPNGSWACALPVRGVEEYRVLTGDVEAARAPDGFLVPRPTTLTACVLCAALGGENFLPVKGADLSIVKRALEDVRKKTPLLPPASPVAGETRRALAAVNPFWEARARELDARLTQAGAKGSEPPPPSEPVPGLTPTT